MSASVDEMQGSASDMERALLYVLFLQLRAQS